MTHQAVSSSWPSAPTARRCSPRAWIGRHRRSSTWATGVRQARHDASGQDRCRGVQPRRQDGRFTGSYDKTGAALGRRHRATARPRPDDASRPAEFPGVQPRRQDSCSLGSGTRFPHWWARRGSGKSPICPTISHGSGRGSRCSPVWCSTARARSGALTARPGLERAGGWRVKAVLPRRFSGGSSIPSSSGPRPLRGPGPGSSRCSRMRPRPPSTEAV